MLLAHPELVMRVGSDACTVGAPNVVLLAQRVPTSRRPTFGPVAPRLDLLVEWRPGIGSVCLAQEYDPSVTVTVTEGSVNPVIIPIGVSLHLASSHGA